MSKQVKLVLKDEEFVKSAHVDIERADREEFVYVTINGQRVATIHSGWEGEISITLNSAVVDAPAGWFKVEDYVTTV